MKRALLAFLFVWAFASPAAADCLPGHSHMGCSLPNPAAYPIPHSLGPASVPGPLFSDVSSYQRHVNWDAYKSWQQSHGWPTGAVFKMGEYSTDSYAAYNNSNLAARGMWRAGYWFVRATGCARQANQIISAARGYHLVLVALDIEVPEAHGYTECLAPVVKAAGFRVVVYGGAGTWPGGSRLGFPLWLAAYTTQPHPWCDQAGGPCNLTAWQFSDGQFGSPVRVPGIDNGAPGYDDVNVDLGISALARPVDPYALFATGPFYLDGKWLNERATVRAWDSNHCKTPPRRAVCVRNYDALKLLAARIWFVAHHNGPGLEHYHANGDWGARRWLGPRLALINARIAMPVSSHAVAHVADFAAADRNPIATHPVYYPLGGWVAPGTPYSWQHPDQGRDLVIPWNGVLRAPGEGYVLGVGSDRPFPGGFGPAYPMIHLTSGRWAGVTIYLGHTTTLVRTGQAVHFGTAVAHADQGRPSWIRAPHPDPPGDGGWVELGQRQDSGLLGPNSDTGHWYDALLRSSVVVQVPDPPISVGQHDWRVYGLSLELRDCGYLNRPWFTYARVLTRAVAHFKAHHRLAGPPSLAGATFQGVLHASVRQCRAARVREVTHAD